MSATRIDAEEAPALPTTKEIAPEHAAAEAEAEEKRPSGDLRTVYLGGLFFLACMAALYLASEIIMPVILAIVLKLLLQPLVRLTDRLRIPRVLGALLAVIVVLIVLSALVTALTGPAVVWATKLPETLPRIRERLHFLAEPIGMVQNLMHRVDLATASVAGQPAGEPGHGDGISWRAASIIGIVFRGTRATAAGLFTTLLVLFYLLISGETFLRRLVEILPRFGDKRKAVEISMHVERDVSAYLLTITLINLVVGFCTGLVMSICGVGDPLLWGTIAFALNFMPIIGPMIGIALYAAVGMLSLGVTWFGLLPAALYLLIHIVEGEAVTPMLMARRFTINPVAVVLGLVFWFWMWGMPGAILAVPMLAIVKIVCDNLPRLRAFGHFLEG
jgi:predicted PurR-regulated permease PerM